MQEQLLVSSCACIRPTRSSRAKHALVVETKARGVAKRETRRSFRRLVGNPRRRCQSCRRRSASSRTWPSSRFEPVRHVMATTHRDVRRRVLAYGASSDRGRLVARRLRLLAYVQLRTATMCAVRARRSCCTRSSERGLPAVRSVASEGDRAIGGRSPTGTLAACGQ